MAAALAVLAYSSVASAQNISVVQAQIKRNLTSRLVGSGPWDISYADCLSADQFTFPVTVLSSTGRSLEVWVGNETGDCTLSAQRGQINPVVCRQIFGPVTVSKTGTQVALTDKSITEGLGISACQDSGQLGHKLTLFFLLKADAAEDVDASNVWTWTGTIVDLAGPVAPLGVSAGIGDTALIVDFAKSDATDVTGYRIYWDDGSGPAPTNPQPGHGSISSGSGGSASTSDGGTSTAAGEWPPPPPPPPDGGTGGSGGATAAGGSGGATAAGGSGGATAAGGSGGASASGGSGGTSASGGSGGASGTSGSGSGVSAGEGCPVSKAVIEGNVPDPSYSGFSQESGPATLSGLTNGTSYAVGVVAYDKIGNLGPMSNVACASPQAISDFFSIYREEGGRAGGGCSVSRPGAGPSPIALVSMALLGLGLASRRRTSAFASGARTSRGFR